MKKLKKIIFPVLILVAIVMCLSGCTEKQMTLYYGGNITIDLPAGQKLEEITWKIDGDFPNLWYLTRPMREDEFPETHTFQEDSNWGVWEGTITVVEH